MDASTSGEIVIAAVTRNALPAVLTAVHRGGVGHLTRVLDPKRSPVFGQLDRAGVSVPNEFVLDTDAVAVMIAAPARTQRVEALLIRSGASRTWLTDRIGEAMPQMFSSLVATPRQRRGTRELTD